MAYETTPRGSDLGRGCAALVTLVTSALLLAPAAQAHQPFAPPQTSASPQMVARTSIGPIDGPTLLRTVLPMPRGEGTNQVHGEPSEFSLQAAGTVLVTDWRPCRFHADGSLASIELSAWCPFAVGAEQVLVVRGASALPQALIPPETVDLYYEGFSLRIDGGDGLVEASLGNINGDISIGPAYAEIAHGGQLGPYGGFRAWVRSMRDAPLVEIDLMWHNADVTSPDPDVRFDIASLELPPGWRAMSVVPRPDMYNTTAGAKNRFVIADDGPHTLLQLCEYHGRFVLYREGQEELAARQAGWRGWGVCLPGLPNEGLWSFWNPNTAWYTAHGVALPLVAHYSRDTFIERVEDNWQDMRTTLIDGTTFSGTPYGAMGWIHHRGVPYGGATGGYAIEYAPGMEALRAGIPEGLLEHIAACWVDANRSTANLYDAVGNPLDLDTYSYLNNLDDELDFRFEIVPEQQAEGHTNKFIEDVEPFGFTTAGDRFSTDPGAAAYEHELRKFGSFDGQHGGRYLYEPVILAGAANDRLAKHMLVSRAMANRADNWEGEGGDEFGHYGWLYDLISANPGQGSGLGRAEGWTLDIAVEAYSLLHPSRRQWLRRPIETLVDMMWLAQTPIGFVQATCQGKAAWSVTPGGSSAPVYRCAAQPYEACIQVNGLRKAAAFAFEPTESRWFASRRVLIDLTRACAWAWHPDGGNTWDTIALREESGAPFYQSQADVPADGKIGKSSYYMRGPLLYALLGTFELGDVPALKDVSALILAHAQDQTLLEEMQDNYLQQLGMKAHLMWLAENVPQTVLESFLLL